MQRPDPALYAGDLFGEYYQAERPTASRRVSLRLLMPGLLTCLIAALASLWLAEHYGFPAILLGLLIGLALNFLAQLDALEAGLDFASRHFLRVGIVLLGLQLTVMDISGVGWIHDLPRGRPAARTGHASCARGQSLDATAQKQENFQRIFTSQPRTNAGS